MKCHLVLISARMIAIVNSCGFGNYAIQRLYDRFELFRKTNGFGQTNNEILLRDYSYEEIDGIKELGMKINDESMKEFYKNNAANEIETIRGYYIKDNVTLDYKRDKNGEMIFEDLSNAKQLEFTLQTIGAELPKNVFLDLKTMRQKIFDFHKGLSKDDLERVRHFNLSRTDGGCSAYYVENSGGGETTVISKLIDGKETISGRISCNSRHQIYNVFNGKVAVDGEFNPINLLLFFLALFYSNSQLNQFT